MKVTFINVTDATPRSQRRAKEGVKIFSRFGFEAKVGVLLGYRQGQLRYFADQRARVFNQTAKTADLIGCTNGGFFAIEMLDGINYSLLRKKQTVIFGFSDITHLLYAAWSRAKVRGVYVTSHIMKSALASKVFKSLKNNQPVSIDYSTRFTFIKSGQAKGVFIPGADQCLYNMFTSDYSFSNRGKVILLESHYHNSIKDFLYWMIVAKREGFFQGVAGLIIGPQPFTSKKRFNSSETMIREVLQIFKKDKFPIAVSKKLSQRYDFVLPFGGFCLMDSAKKKITVTF